jgi:hypothetical protein
MMESDSPPPIHVAMSRVLAALPAIGKNRVNVQQKFNFRGVDDVLNALNPLLAEHGVIVVPHRVLARDTGVRQTKGGGTMYEVSLHVRYRFYGPAGDYIEAEGWGEGTDSGDKATPKAMTGAYKYVLFQAFSISTEEASKVDADRYSPDESIPVAPKKVVEDLAKRIATLTADQKTALKADWISGGLSPLAFGKFAAGDVDDASDLIARYEVEPSPHATDPEVAQGSPVDALALAAPPSTKPAGPADVDPGRPFEEGA